MATKTPTKPKFHLITYGCQMNKSDSERVSTILQNVGMESTDSKEDADFILINTCSVRQRAEDRVFGQVENFKPLKEENPDLIVGITGCMPGRDRDGKIRDRLPDIVDLYFPISDVTQLPRWLGEMKPEMVNSADLEDDYLKITPDYNKDTQAFVSIQTGCNKFCTYCVVPFSRGLEKNRPVRDIMSEVHKLADNGCLEIVLLGQTVNSYEAPDPEHFSDDNPYENHFAALMWEIDRVDQIKRMYFTAPHPMHMTDEVIDAMTLPTHLNYIHLPVQAGDDEVLRKMNRRYTVEQYLDVIERIREKMPNIAIATDIIVGFCGESKEQFQKTVDLYKEVAFDISYTAQYSERSGTAAARAFKDDVDKSEKKRRWNVLQALMEDMVYEKNQKLVGETVSVLVERHEDPKITDEMLEMTDDVQEHIKQLPGFCYGKSREMKLVRFPAEEKYVGRIVDVKINEADTWLLVGEVVD